MTNRELECAVWRALGIGSIATEAPTWFQPTHKEADFALIYEEIERRGWIYEHASYLLDGRRVHYFWIAEPDATAEMDIVHALTMNDADRHPTRRIAGCHAFVEAVKTYKANRKMGE